MIHTAIIISGILGLPTNTLPAACHSVSQARAENSPRICSNDRRNDDGPKPPKEIDDPGKAITGNPHGPDPHGPDPHDEFHDKGLPANDLDSYLKKR